MQRAKTWVAAVAVASSLAGCVAPGSGEPDPFTPPTFDHGGDEPDPITVPTFDHGSSDASGIELEDPFDHRASDPGPTAPDLDPATTPEPTAPDFDHGDEGSAEPQHLDPSHLEVSPPDFRHEEDPPTAPPTPDEAAATSAAPAAVAPPPASAAPAPRATEVRPRLVEGLRVEITEEIRTRSRALATVERALTVGAIDVESGAPAWIEVLSGTIRHGEHVGPVPAGRWNYQDGAYRPASGEGGAIADPFFTWAIPPAPFEGQPLHSSDRWRFAAALNTAPIGIAAATITEPLTFRLESRADNGDLLYGVRGALEQADGTTLRIACTLSIRGAEGRFDQVFAQTTVTHPGKEPVVTTVRHRLVYAD